MRVWSLSDFLFRGWRGRHTRKTNRLMLQLVWSRMIGAHQHIIECVVRARRLLFFCVSIDCARHGHCIYVDISIASNHDNRMRFHVFIQHFKSFSHQPPLSRVTHHQSANPNQPWPPTKTGIPSCCARTMQRATSRRNRRPSSTRRCARAMVRASRVARKSARSLSLLASFFLFHSPSLTFSLFRSLH